MRIDLHNAVAYDEHGRLMGAVVAFDVELVNDPLTPTDVRTLVGCTFCGARRGQMCTRWRGGIRKANHAERIAAARRLLGR